MVQQDAVTLALEKKEYRKRAQMSAITEKERENTSRDSSRGTMSKRSLLHIIFIRGGEWVVGAKVVQRSLVRLRVKLCSRVVHPR